MNKVFFRKVLQTKSDSGNIEIYASERLDLTIDQEFRRVGFGFTSRIRGVADIRGSVAFPGHEEKTVLTHSSGEITSESLSNMNALQALLNRLDTCCASGMSDAQILDDKRIQLILKNNDFKSLDSYEVKS